MMIKPGGERAPFIGILALTRAPAARDAEWAWSWQLPLAGNHSLRAARLR
jgi:hypothetical protein